MKVLNIEVIDIHVERYSKENYLEVCLTTTNGAYIAKVAILGVSDIEFWRESYGVAGSPVWTESNVHDVLTYKVKAVSDDDGSIVTGKLYIRKDRKSTRLNSSHSAKSRMPSSA